MIIFKKNNPKKNIDLQLNYIFRLKQTTQLLERTIATYLGLGMQ